MRALLLGLAATAATVACGGNAATPPLAPGLAQPIPAPDPPPDRPAAEVCGGLIEDLERYQACVPEERRELIDAWLDRARIDVAALGAAGVSDADRRDTARACARASDAVRAAIAACVPTPGS